MAVNFRVPIYVSFKYAEHSQRTFLIRFVDQGIEERH